MHHGSRIVDKIASEQSADAAPQMADAAAYALSRWQHFYAWNDLMAGIFKAWRQIENATSSIDVYLREEQSWQISSRSDLKLRSLRLF